MRTLLLALAVFVSTAAVDALFVRYTQMVVAHSPARAASLGSAIHVINAFVVISYTGDWRYVAAVVTGSWVGTYLTVRLSAPAGTDAGRPPPAA